MGQFGGLKILLHICHGENPIMNIFISVNVQGFQENIQSKAGFDFHSFFEMWYLSTVCGGIKTVTVWDSHQVAKTYEKSPP